MTINVLTLAAVTTLRSVDFATALILSGFSYFCLVPQVLLEDRSISASSM